MIEDHDKLFDRIRRFDWNPTQDSYQDKLEALDAALTGAVSGLGDDVHLNLSGGVDSTLLLRRLVSWGVPVTAHTMAGDEENLDLVHAKYVCEALGVRHQVHLVRRRTRTSWRVLICWAVPGADRTPTTC